MVAFKFPHRELKLLQNSKQKLQNEFSNKILIRARTSSIAGESTLKPIVNPREVDKLTHAESRRSTEVKQIHRNVKSSVNILTNFVQTLLYGKTTKDVQSFFELVHRIFFSLFDNNFRKKLNHTFEKSSYRGTTR